MKARVASAADRAWEAFRRAVDGERSYASPGWRREIIVALAKGLAEVNAALAAELPGDHEAPE